MSPCCLCNEEFGYCATVLLSLLQNIGESVLSSLILEKPCIKVGGWLKESFCNASAKLKGCLLPGMDETLLYASVICF